ncbi:MAG: GntR family transcriptional regulator [Lachnospiraceae bacterium]|nr:GntR family transcriptional regulator [Lachnospiraceae bacterium]
MRKNKEKLPSAVDQVVSAITDEIIRGELRPGERLSPEPDLALKYGVGRNSVREAIKQLQAYGVLYIKRADGTYLVDSFQGKMLDPLLYNLIFDNEDQEDLAQLRSVIEIGTLQVALLRPKAKEVIPTLNRLLAEIEAEFRKEEPSPEEILDRDLRFHKAIAAIIGNPQVDILTDYITRMTIPARTRAVEKWIELGKQAEFIRLHREIIDVIDSCDASRVTQVVENHYVFLRKILKEEGA